MVKIGITGNIGSGKSTVCSIFEQFGWPIYDSDERAKWLMNNQIYLKNLIIDLLGTESYYNNGTINKEHIAKTIFNNSELLRKLNNIVHPAVKEDFKKWCSKNKEKKYLVKESALIYEAQLQKDLDLVVVVSSSSNVSIDRVMLRDSLSRNQVLEKIKNQMPSEEKNKLADFVIFNDNPNDFLKNTLAVYRQIKTIYN